MYCLKCKSKTETRDSANMKTKNNRYITKGICVVCGSKKSKFISNKIGEGIFNNILSKVGDVVGEMHLPADQGEFIPNGSFNDKQKYSYCGPGTKYEQRNKEGYEGINELDKGCKTHDKFYTDHSDTASRNISDEVLANKALNIANNPSYDNTQRNMAKLVYYILKNKARFGLGLGSQKKSKN